MLYHDGIQFIDCAPLDINAVISEEDNYCPIHFRISTIEALLEIDFPYATCRYTVSSTDPENYIIQLDLRTNSTPNTASWSQLFISLLSNIIFNLVRAATLEKELLIAKGIYHAN